MEGSVARKVLIAAGAVGTAAAVGFFMQMGAGQPGHAAAPAASVVLTDAPSEPAPMALSGITLTSSLPETGESTARPLAAPTSAPRLDTMPEPGADRLPGAPAVASITEAPAEESGPAECRVELAAQSSVAALVSLSFSANCAPYTRVSFAHEGMEFGELTDSDGRIEIAVPALAETAVFTATLPDGTGAEATTQVGSVLFYDRIVLQTEGRTGLTLHALEFGAGYEDEGHVWAGAPRDPSVAARGEGGFLMMLGDPSLPDADLAQVYSYPSGTSLKAGEVAMSVEAEVLRATCDGEVTATITRIREGERAAPQQVTLPMPDCDSVGGFLVLKSPVNDLKIAGR